MKWFVSMPNENCDQSCHQLGLICTEKELQNHKNEVDHCDEVEALVESNIDANVSICNSDHGAGLYVPILEKTQVHSFKDPKNVSAVNELSIKWTNTPLRQVAKATICHYGMMEAPRRSFSSKLSVKICASVWIFHIVQKSIITYAIISLIRHST